MTSTSLPLSLPSSESPAPRDGQLLQGTLDSLEDHIAILDQTGKIVSINAAWRRFADENNFAGHEAGMGANYLEVCAQATGAGAEESPLVGGGIREVLEGKRDNFYLEYPCHAPHEERWFSLRATHFQGDDGLRVVVSHENISARKQTEFRLREESEIIETLYRIGQVVAAELDLQKIVAAVTDAATELTGAQCGTFVPNSPEAGPVIYSSCELPGRDSWESWRQKWPDLVPFTDEFRQIGVIRSGDVQNDPGRTPDEAYWQIPFDHWRVASYLAAPVVSRAGKVVGGLFLGHEEKDFFSVRHKRLIAGLAAQAAVALDNARLFEIARQERAEAAASERRFRFVTESVPQIIWVTAPNGDHEYFNQRWYDFTGESPEESLGQGWVNPLHPDDRERARIRWQHSLETGEPYEIEYRFRGQDGDYHWFLGRALPQRDENGDILRWFGTCTDIDEQKRVAAERARMLESEAAARQEAETANRIKDEFLAVVSHELRTPLTPILGWTSMLLGDDELDDQTRLQAYKAIERNAKSQSQIINDLLDVSRIISGKLRLAVKPLDLAEVVAAAVETVTPAANARGIQVETKAPEGAGLISGDFDRLQQVVWNLLTNAIKFTPREGRVAITLRRVDSSAEIAVSDSGQGIAPEFLPYVFERFRQADATSTRIQGGLGLGLSIVRYLIEQHGGSVLVESEGLGEGTTFRVRLPILPILPEGPEATNLLLPQSLATLPAEVRLDGLKILVVEDEADGRAMLRAALTRYGAEVEIAANVAQALEVFARVRPDCLISDIGMPGEDGYALIRQIRALAPEQGGQTPALALTAYARKEDRAKALEAGFDEHLTKPVAPGELVTAIEKLINPSRFVD